MKIKIEIEKSGSSALPQSDTLYVQYLTDYTNVEISLWIWEDSIDRLWADQKKAQFIDIHNILPEETIFTRGSRAGHSFFHQDT